MLLLVALTSAAKSSSSKSSSSSTTKRGNVVYLYTKRNYKMYYRILLSTVTYYTYCHKDVHAALRPGFDVDGFVVLASYGLGSGILEVQGEGLPHKLVNGC